MADAGDDDDLFADLYDDTTNNEDSAPASAPIKTEPAAQASAADDDFEQPEPERKPVIVAGSTNVPEARNDNNYGPPQGMGGMDSYQDGGDFQDSRPEERPIGTKEDG